MNHHHSASPRGGLQDYPRIARPPRGVLPLALGLADGAPSPGLVEVEGDGFLHGHIVFRMGLGGVGLGSFLDRDQGEGWCPNPVARVCYLLGNEPGMAHAPFPPNEALLESGMRRNVLVYGLLGGVLIAGLRLIEFRWLVVEHSVEIYGGLVAAVFASLGIWLGLRLTRRTETVVVREVPAPVPFLRDEAKLESLGITPRELEILGLIAEGLSTREIAARVFVSENTVKTHSSRVFFKLGARRRTQAVQLGKEFRLIP